jgi:uncharacterized protein YecT (DUF1311 family)
MSFCRAVFCAALLMGAPSSGSVRAQAARTEDLAVIKACLDRVDRRAIPQDASEACVSQVAMSCFGGDETSTAPTHVIDCFDRERHAWDEILNDAYQSTMERLSEGPRTKFQDMQLSWIRTRDLTCGFLLEAVEGGMAPTMAEACLNREAARRAIYLRSVAIALERRRVGIRRAAR